MVGPSLSVGWQQGVTGSPPPHGHKGEATVVWLVIELEGRCLKCLFNLMITSAENGFLRQSRLHRLRRGYTVNLKTKVMGDTQLGFAGFSLPCIPETLKLTYMCAGLPGMPGALAARRGSQIPWTWRPL